jgi:hypothetical protein
MYQLKLINSTGGEGQVVEHLSSKHKALSLNSSTSNK